MKNTLLLLIAVLTVWSGIYADELVSVAHVSYLDGGLIITNRDGNEHQATVNFPILAGDILRTRGDGRAEIQFGNGTLLRMDQDSELLVGTILAPFLTSKDGKLTTLELKTGKVFVNSNTYNNEMLQIVSEDVAVKFTRNSNVQIGIAEKGTRVTSLWGRTDLLVVDEKNRSRMTQLKTGNAVLVNKTGEIVMSPVNREGDFLAWNRMVDKHFKELHEGKSYVPDKITRHTHLQKWAERWSSRFGTWVYDKMYGYVWKPGGFAVDPTRRPFYNGTLVVLNGEEYIVPNEPWGWAPAHLGTWVFLKKWGWTWIPGQGGGEIFMPRVNTIMDWLWKIWGSPSYYAIYLNEGWAGWRDYYIAHSGHPPMFDVSDAPPAVRTILKKMDLAHPHQVKAMLAAQSDEFVNKKMFSPTNRGVSTKTRSVKELAVSPGVPKSAPKDLLPAAEGKNKGKGKISAVGQAIHLRHDWNPDRQWATKNRVQLLYSSHSNSVIIPQLKYDSASLTSHQRSVIRRSQSAAVPGSNFGYTGSGSAQSSSVPTGNASSGSSSKEKK